MGLSGLYTMRGNRRTSFFDDLKNLLSRWTLGLFLVLAGACSTAPKDPTAVLQGVWNCQSASVNGTPLDPEIVNSLRLTLTRDHYKTERGNDVLFESTYRVNAKRRPREISMVATEGPLAGKEGLGIYSLEGDLLRLCYAMPGARRPTNFVSGPGSNITLTRWKRGPR